MTKTNSKRFLLVLTGLLFCACGGVRVEPVPVNIQRFEEDLFLIKLNGLDQDLKVLEQKYPDFFQLYMQKILAIGSLDDSLSRAKLTEFLSNEAILKLYRTCASKFSDLTQLEADLGGAFGMMKHYFPRQPTPRVITFISEFGHAAVTLDSSVLGIGLDMYLGRDYKYYPSLGFPNYMIRRLQHEYMVPNAVEAILGGMFELSNNKLIDKIVYNGKIYYMAKQILPETEDSLFTGYSSNQMKWCEDNEREIWAFFITKDLLFSSNLQQYNKYVSEGPNSSGMPPESPGNIGSWVGWQIVRKYMDKYPELSLSELMQIDARKMLNQSGYKP